MTRQDSVNLAKRFSASRDVLDAISMMADTDEDESTPSSDRAPVALADAGWTRDPAEGDPPGFWVELATRHSPPASDCGCSRFGETPRREEGWVLGRVWGYEGLRVAESNTEAAQI